MFWLRELGLHHWHDENSDYGWNIIKSVRLEGGLTKTEQPYWYWANPRLPSVIVMFQNKWELAICDLDRSYLIELAHVCGYYFFHKAPSAATIHKAVQGYRAGGTPSSPSKSGHSDKLQMPKMFVIK